MNFFKKLIKNKSNKKFNLIYLLIFILSLTNFFAVKLHASEFIDSANSLAEKSIIKAKTDSSDYRLWNNVTRWEIAKISAKIWGYSTNKSDCVGDVFKDVWKDLWDLCTAIESLAVVWKINTKALFFRPNDPVSRAELIKMLISTRWTELTSKKSNFVDINWTWDMKKYIETAVSIWIIKNSSYFRPNDLASRWEAFKVAIKAILSPKNKAEYSSWLLNEINWYRVKNKLWRVYLNSKLTDLAKVHSKYMSSQKKLSHDYFSDRFTKSWFNSCVENVWWNYFLPNLQFTW